MADYVRTSGSLCGEYGRARGDSASAMQGIESTNGFPDPGTCEPVALRRAAAAIAQGDAACWLSALPAAARDGRPDWPHRQKKAGQTWPESPQRPGDPCVLRRRMAAAAPGPGLVTWRERRRSAPGPRRWPEIRDRLRPRFLSKAETTRRGPGTLFEPEKIQCIIELVHTDARVPDAAMSAAVRARRTGSGPERPSIVDGAAGILWM